MIFAGVDWAEAHHDVHFKTRTARRLAGGRLRRGSRASPGSTIWLPRTRSPGEVVIGIETDRGLFAAALAAAGYQVFAVNPKSAPDTGNGTRSSGAKSDPGDAKVLADLVRTDRHNHRPVVPDSDLAEGVRVAGPGASVDDLDPAPAANQLRSVLREFYPAALAAFDDLGSGDAAEVLKTGTRAAAWRRVVQDTDHRCLAARGPDSPPRPSGPPPSRRRCAPRSCSPRR